MRKYLFDYFSDITRETNCDIVINKELYCKKHVYSHRHVFELRENMEKIRSHPFMLSEDVFYDYAYNKFNLHRNAATGDVYWNIINNGRTSNVNSTDERGIQEYNINGRTECGFLNEFVKEYKKYRRNIAEIIPDIDYIEMYGYNHLTFKICTLKIK